MERAHRAATRAAANTARAADRAVRDYLSAIRETPGARRRSVAAIRSHLARTEQELEHATPIEELLLLQQRRDLSAELRSLTEIPDVADLEAGFVAVAAAYGRSRGLSYDAWTELGVHPEVLEDAGIRRNSA